MGWINLGQPPKAGLQVWAGLAACAQADEGAWGQRRAVSRLAMGNSSGALPQTHCPVAPAGESGVGSGVRREWFRLLMGHFLDGRSGLLASADGGRTWQPSVDARLQGDHLPFFHILGEPTGLGKVGHRCERQASSSGHARSHGSGWSCQGRPWSELVDDSRNSADGHVLALLSGPGPATGLGLASLICYFRDLFCM